MHNQPREPQPYEDCRAKSIQEFGWTSQGMDWGWGQGIKSTTHRCVEEFGYSCRQRRLTWAKKKKNWTVAQWSKVLFSDESKFCISFGNQGPRVWRKGGEAHKLLEVQCEVSTVSDDLGAMSFAGVGLFCFLKTNVTAPVYQEILEHFMLPSADQLFKDADFIFQQDLAPVHTAKSTKSWLNDHGVGVLDWPANSPDLNPTENLWETPDLNIENLWETPDLNIENLWETPGPEHRESMRYCQEENEKQETKQCRWAEGHCQRNLGFTPPQQCHKLITSMPRCIEAVIKAKGAPTKYWVHIQ